MSIYKKDIYQLACTAMKNNEFYEFMRGNDAYRIGVSHLIPIIEIHDVSLVLSEGIYRLYKENQSTKELYENTLLRMLKGTDYDVYMVCDYVYNHLCDDSYGHSSFRFDRKEIFESLRVEIPVREQSIRKEVQFPDGTTNHYIWEEIQGYNNVCFKRFSIQLF